MYKLIRKKKIKVCRKRAEAGQILRENDTVELFISDEFFEKKEDGSYLSSLKVDLRIVYEDENVLLSDKRPGMIVHSDDRNENGTLIDHIKAYLIQKGEYSPESENSFAPALCNRIDRNTGGIVIAAKNAETLRILNQKIKDREITKKYLLAVKGVPEKRKGTLRNYLVKNGDANTVEVFDKPVKNGRTAITEYRVLKEKNGLSLIEATLCTGRTHQIRAQFAHIGHPLLGDGKYGVNRDDRKMGFDHQALYSYKISFDFKTDAERLDYLKGKTFEVDKNSIFFGYLFE